MGASLPNFSQGKEAVCGLDRCRCIIGTVMEKVGAERSRSIVGMLRP